MTLSIDWFQNKYRELNGTNDLWIAYSGGVDSRVLLELCHQYANYLPNCKLQAIHINHGLHKDAALWQAHCLATCKFLNIPIHVVPIQLDLTSGDSIEALARHARRAIWQELLPANSTLLLAHHEQDQAETILYRLFRGAGITGLAGMQERGKFGRGLLLRPLLTIPKTIIDQFAYANKLTWIVDSSNHDTKFDRNFIRHAIIPELSKRWPKVVTNITRSGELCAETKLLLAVEVDELISRAVGMAVGTLSISKLLALDEVRCFAVLRAWIATNNYEMPSRSQLYKIKSEVMLARDNVKPKLQCSQYTIRRYRDDLYLLAKEPMNHKETFIVNINATKEIRLATGKILRFSKTKVLGFVLPDNIMEITVNIGSKGEKAKKIFQQQGVPPWRRAQYPLVFLGNELIHVAGLWTKPEFMAGFDKPGFEVALINMQSPYLKN